MYIYIYSYALSLIYIYKLEIQSFWRQHLFLRFFSFIFPNDGLFFVVQFHFKKKNVLSLVHYGSKRMNIQMDGQKKCIFI